MSPELEPVLQFQATAQRAVHRRVQTALSSVEQRDGLGRALDALVVLQQENGFAPEFEESLRRITPDRDGVRPLYALLNCARRQRHAGFGRGKPPEGVTFVHGGCYLCLPNVWLQQHGRQYHHPIVLAGRPFAALANPFPIFQRHLTIATTEHLRQARSVEAIAAEAIELAARAQGYVVVMNGEGAGASLPRHAHFHAVRPPHEAPLVEAARSGGNDGPTVVVGYPIPVLYRRAEPKALTPMLVGWMRTWEHLGPLGATFNIALVAEDPEHVEAFFVPRCKTLERAPGLAGAVAGIEALGYLVCSGDEEVGRVERGDLTYAQAAAVLSAVAPPGVERFLRRAAGGDGA